MNSIKRFWKPLRSAVNNKLYYLPAGGKSHSKIEENRDMMTRVKTGGRKPGTPNKVTVSMRVWIVGLINDNREKLEKDLDKLPPKDRWAIVERLLQYAIPKKQSVQSNINFDKMTNEQLDEIINQLKNETE